MAVSHGWLDGVQESIGLKKWRYGRVQQNDLDDDDDNDLPQPIHAPPSRWSRSWKAAAALTALFFVILFFAWPSSSSRRTYSTASSDEEGDVFSSYFHLMLVGQATGANFCKSIFSAAVLDYPTPRLIDWESREVDSKKPPSNEFRKISALNDFLGFLGDAGHDEELMVIASANETWFQLRPSTMIQRYYNINKQANQRIRARFGDSAVNKYDLEQRVVFSAQGQCSSGDKDAIECYAVPESAAGPAAKSRPRYLSSGTIIGRVKELRPIFDAATKLAEGSANGTDRDPFARLFGQQEFQREYIRSKNSWFFTRLWTFLTGPDPRGAIIQSHATREQMSFEGDKHEYKIGLDYDGVIAQPPGITEKELAWMVHGPSEHTSAEVARKLPDEVLHSTPPFWTADYTGYAQSLLPDKDWSEVSLFTNKETGVAPATIHHTTHRKGMKDRVRAMWEDTWYHEHLRVLLNTKANAWRMPHAYLTTDERTEEWWGPIDERGGWWAEPGGMRWWEDACGSDEVAETVIPDGKGEYSRPIYYLPDDHGQQDDLLKKWGEAFENGTIPW